jgi:hypothetical protein
MTVKVRIKDESGKITLALSFLQSLCRNVFSVVGAFEIHFAAGFVGAVYRCLQICCSRGDSEDTASCGMEISVAVGRSGMEHFCACYFCCFVQTGYFFP